MARYHSRSRVRLFVEPLEDRAQPAQLALAQLANLAALDPVANPTPAVIGNRVAGVPNVPGNTFAASAPAAASPAAAEPALIIFFSPSDQSEFTILVEPSQFALPASNILPILNLTEAAAESGVRVVFVDSGFVGQTEADFLRTERLAASIAAPAANAVEHPASAVAAVLGPLFAPEKAPLPVTLLGVPIGYGMPEPLEVAPPPHAVEAPPMAPAPKEIEIAPPPREVDPAANAPAPVSMAIPQTTEELAAPAAAAAAVSDVKPSAVEQPEAANAPWGWFGALAAALSVGGYWMLHRSALARAAKLRHLRSGLGTRLLLKAHGSAKS